MNTDSCTKIPNDSESDAIIIVGAGWSGLACAVTLVHHGYKVCLLESARQIGGRARSIEFKDQFSNHAIDNGQHIMLGAYHYTRDLLHILRLDETEILEHKPLELKMFSPEHENFHFKAPLLPAPFHLLYGLLSLTGLSLRSRIKAIKFSLALALSNYNLKQDISVSTLLKQHAQTEEIILTLWEPLCLATMNTPIDYASASVFLNVLKTSFSSKRQDSDLLFFRHDLSNFFCLPSLKYLQKNNSRIHCAHKVKSVEIIPAKDTHSAMQFCINTQAQNFHSQQLILATPAHISDKLLLSINKHHSLQGKTVLRPDNASLLFAYEPICTIYLQYPEHIKLSERMIGFFNTTAQWAIDRSLNHQPGLIAVVISGPGQHTQMDSEALVQTIHQELRLSVIDLPKPLYYKIITEKKATFSCRVDINKQRPLNTTRLPGLFLAGDYTDTKYPSTLEGAIKSGVLAAREVIKNSTDSVC